MEWVGLKTGKSWPHCHTIVLPKSLYSLNTILDSIRDYFRKTWIYSTTCTYQSIRLWYMDNERATSHYIIQCWRRSMSPNGVTRPRWVNVLWGVGWGLGGWGGGWGWGWGGGGWGGGGWGGGGGGGVGGGVGGGGWGGGGVGGCGGVGGGGEMAKFVQRKEVWNYI